jgi:hypothetical protein
MVGHHQFPLLDPPSFCTRQHLNYEQTITNMTEINPFAWLKNSSSLPLQHALNNQYREILYDAFNVHPLYQTRIFRIKNKTVPHWIREKLIAMEVFQPTQNHDTS